ncbi:MAG TPA: hypothetical protein HA306_11230 [Methanosarcina sp.]|nr:hypothetical protein [Methanosarcina sp.]
MGYKKFDNIKKILAFLLIICFSLSVTVAPAAAGDNGYYDGYRKGYSDGKKQSEKDCKQYGSRENLSKIPSPFYKDSWTRSYKNNYNKGYRKGYIDGYNGNRYECLK